MHLAAAILTRHSKGGDHPRHLHLARLGAAEDELLARNLRQQFGRRQELASRPPAGKM